MSKKIVIGSLRGGSGKTTLIIGLSFALNGKVGYLKPIGDRLLYKKKRLWDYDGMIMTKLFNLEEKPEDITIGFDHLKLSFMFTKEGLKERLNGIIHGLEHTSSKEIIFVEGGAHLSYGASVNLDVIEIARIIDGELVLVIAGEDYAIVDDLTFIRRDINLSDVKFKGVVLNKVKDIEEFNGTYGAKIKELGIKILGMIPFREELTAFTVEYLTQVLFAKVVAGEGGLHKTIKNIFVGAMSASEALKNPLFQKEKKLIITSGDRSDLILAALDTDTSAMVLTNNILPPPNILSKASEKNVPLLLVPLDTFQAAKKVDDMEPLLTIDEKSKLTLIREIIREKVEMEAILD